MIKYELIWNHLVRAVCLNVLGIWHLENKRFTGSILSRNPSAPL